MSRKPDDDRDDFQQWVQPLLEQAAGYAYSIVGNHPDAEDAVQEALWKAYRGLHGYDRARPFKGWWFAIVRNCCLDLFQQRHARRYVAANTLPLAEPAQSFARTTRAPFRQTKRSRG